MLTPSYIIDMIKDAHVKNPYSQIKRNYLATSEGSEFLGGGLTNDVSQSRSKIVRLSGFLRHMSSFMVLYSLVYLAMKIIDLSQLSERLKQHRDSQLFVESHDKFMILYHQVNYVSLLFSLLVVMASIYIKWSLGQTQIFNSTQYKRFILSCFLIVMLYLGLFVYFILCFFNHTKLDLIGLLDGISAISKLQSDSPTRTLAETISGILMIAGLYALILLSNEIEDEIRRLDMLRAKSNAENSLYISQMEMF